MSNSLSEQLQALPDAIRNPQQCAGIDDIESRRIKIYQDLFYNNIEGFISSGFPVLRSIYSDRDWHQLVGQFVRDYRCQTPYFLEISQEFIQFLQQRQLQAGDPRFLIELAHYEWVELALDTETTDLTAMPYDREGDLLNKLPVVSPLAWPLAYQFPVHQISRSFQPTEPAEQPVYLIVYRNRHHKVNFMESNAVTCRLLTLLTEEDVDCGAVALRKLATEMAYEEPDALINSGYDIFKQLLAEDILLGV